jgi:carbamoyltransferase
LIVLGLHSGFFLGQHDPSAALVVDGEIVAACEEERFLRVKSPCGVLPVESIRTCLAIAGLEIGDVDLVVHPGATIEGTAGRVDAYLRHFFGAAPPVEVIPHHLAHVASAYHAAGMADAVSVSYDAWGDRISTAIAVPEGGRPKLVEMYGRQQSLGLFYGTITSYLGFRVGEDEFKVMGLAAYGKPDYDLSAFLTTNGGAIELDDSFVRADIDACIELEPLYGPRLVDLLGPPRQPGEPITARHCAVACSAQLAFERAVCMLVGAACRRTGSRDVCLAGGGALNCSANLAVARLPEVDRLFVQPAASDRGLSLGCALWGAAEVGDRVAPMTTAMLGRCYDADEIRSACELSGLRVTELEDPAATVADLLVAGRIVGWYTDRSEFGPRALGARSILADPRPATMRDEINARVKFREEFRPFAPAVGAWRAGELLDLDGPSPYMTVAHPVREEWRSRLGAVTHVDGTARVQTVDERAPALAELVRAFEERTGVPAVLNTSFNVRGQPIVETPLDAIGTFAATGLDALRLGPFLATKDRL